MASESHRRPRSIGSSRSGTTPDFDTGLILVPLAATGLVLLMIGAIITHARLKEFPMIAITAVLGALSLWVAIWGYSDLITAPINLLVGRSETGCRPLGTPCTTCC